MSHLLRKLLQQKDTPRLSPQPTKNVLGNLERWLDVTQREYKGYISIIHPLSIDFFAFITKYKIDDNLLFDACNRIHPRFEKKDISYTRGRFPRLSLYKKQEQCVIGSQKFNMNFCLSDSFYMGSNEKEEDIMPRESTYVYPRKNILITKDFFLGETEVTVDLWCEVMGDDTRTDDAKMEWGQAPMHDITWYDAIDFCNRLSEKQGLEKAYLISNVRRKDFEEHKCGMIINSIQSADVVIFSDTKGYRLPTTAQWEYAARARQSQFPYSGSVDADDVGWVGSKLSTPKSVKRKKPNAWGFYDMTGNVWEWCEDCVQDANGKDLRKERRSYGDLTEASNHPNTSFQYRILRGGSVLRSEAKSRVDQEAYTEGSASVLYASGFGKDNAPIGMRVLRYV